MFKLLRKMRVRIGYASLPQVWFNRGQKTMGGGNMDEIARRHVVCFVSKFDHATILYKCVHRRHLTLFGMIA